MRYLRGGKTVKSQLGTSSKLQCPMLFMKSANVIYNKMARMELVLVKKEVSKGIKKSKWYTICSANG